MQLGGPNPKSASSRRHTAHYLTQKISLLSLSYPHVLISTIGNGSLTTIGWHSGCSGVRLGIYKTTRLAISSTTLSALAWLRSLALCELLSSPRHPISGAVQPIGLFHQLLFSRNTFLYILYYLSSSRASSHSIRHSADTNDVRHLLHLRSSRAYQGMDPPLTFRYKPCEFTSASTDSRVAFRQSIRQPRGYKGFKRARGTPRRT